MIALITDFGINDPYVGVVKGVIYSQGYTGSIVDICHHIVPYSIEHAQYILTTSYRYFPDNTIFLVVVDPGVGTQRNILLIHDDRYYFFMPDNGIAGCLNQNTIKVWSVDTQEFVHASSTFHGRDIFAMLASRLAMQGIEAIHCKECTNYVQHPFPWYDIKVDTVYTRVVHIDRFGNCILSLPNEQYSLQLNAIIVNNKRYTLYHCKTYADVPLEAIGILKGSSGFIEICMNQKDASKRLAVTTGDMVELLYE
ncbi:MAG TPA: SAM-dependent chlorinase/fluorinase [Spirochaetota bacterium]|nr:SAM-dependent chlorinase/fluorinase [Spirochaetota bacterium]HOM10923.1 SAM-dependent chlorinase/fluorinase [Spirochaetota bacterium]HPP49593.1 SAM-dependent chlorinase/fluorinase [Spirochaetota bacterium]